MALVDPSMLESGRYTIGEDFATQNLLSNIPNIRLISNTTVEFGNLCKLLQLASAYCLFRMYFFVGFSESSPSLHVCLLLANKVDTIYDPVELLSV